MMKLAILVLAFTSCIIMASSDGDEFDDELMHEPAIDMSRQTTREKSDWNQMAQDDIEKTLKQKLNTNVAKNVIFFLGDGMGPATVTAARFHKAWSQSRTIQKSILAWDEFEHTGLSKTYNTNTMVSDSAGTATAYLCGVKTNIGVIGLNENCQKRDCSQVKESNRAYSVLHYSMKEGKWGGVVTTTRVTHATPAGSYAHTPGRGWEASVPGGSGSNCKDIASQLVDENDDIRVVLGGGRRNFRSSRQGGRRKDGRNLINEWKTKKTNQGRTFKYVKSRSELLRTNFRNTDHLFGLFSESHMDYDIERPADQPSLTEMTESAIKILSKSPKGYFLLVEGGLIDHGHHGNHAFKALNDTLALSDAVAKALTLVNTEETLVVVTADHSHTMTLGGYPDVDANVFGLINGASDHKPMLNLMYANGPGYKSNRVNGIRKNLRGVNTGTKDFRQDAAVPKSSETHGGEDVTIFATGPMSHLFTGVHEQNYIAHAMNYALCVGINKEHCGGIGPTTESTTESTTERTTKSTTKRTTERSTERTTDRTTERTTERTTKQNGCQDPEDL